MSDKLSRAIKEWNDTNIRYTLVVNRVTSTPRSKLIFCIYKDEFKIIEFIGYEGEENLWIDMISRIRIG